MLQKLGLQTLSLNNVTGDLRTQFTPLVGRDLAETGICAPYIGLYTYSSSSLPQYYKVLGGVVILLY